LQSVDTGAGNGAPFSSILATDGQLLLTNAPTSTLDGGVDGEAGINTTREPCETALVNPQTLSVGAISKASCHDPAVYGERVEAVVDLYQGDVSTGTVSVSRMVSRTRIASGPVVMTYFQAGALDGTTLATPPATAYGGGWLWIYDSDTTNGPEVLQVSASTGQVEDTIAMPVLWTPFLVANRAGLWIANAGPRYITDLGPNPGPFGLYHVAPGSPVPVTDLSGDSLCWVVGNGNHLWAATASASRGCLSQTMWRFDGSQTRPLLDAPIGGYQPSLVTGSELDGLWTTEDLASASGLRPAVHIIHIDPDSGVEKVVATVRTKLLKGILPAWSDGTPEATLGHSIFAFEPQGEDGTRYNGSIVRVSTRTR
jgi:hypothetical protein